jgi:hypothetical protein
MNDKNLDMVLKRIKRVEKGLYDEFEIDDLDDL